MNAAEQAKSVDTASKIAAVVNHFKTEFPDAKADLKPWANDRDTRDLVDPDSIDIGFHLPGFSHRVKSRSILVQIRLYYDYEGNDPEPLSSDNTFNNPRCRAIGTEIAGFDHRGKQWQLSTVDQWQVEGNVSPDPDVQERLRRFCRHVFELFNGA
ncbi:MAG: hypothetical protein F6K09_32150 [Merismopedia sp. SIO2A8]|nr:hypothetical protein [Merismopedia sp. SIO2A8]